MQATQALFLLVITLASASTTGALDRKLLDAILEVESNGNECAIGDGGLSIGPYQIMCDYFIDAAKKDPTLKKGGMDVTDVWGQGSSAYAEKVIAAYMCRYATEARLGHKPTNEDIARIHNGGPKGYKKAATLVYWNKVETIIKRICDNENPVYKTAGDSARCRPPCKKGQCCLKDEEGVFKCFCIKKKEKKFITYPCP